MGFDPITMSATISKLKANGQIGYGESKTITYDGTGEKVDLLGTGITFVKIQDEPIDLSKVHKMGSYYSFDNKYSDIGAGDFAVMEAVPGLQGIIDPSQAEDGDSTTPSVLSISSEFEAAPSGLYFLDCDFEITRTYTTYIEYGGIKPIDPKYLPPDVLPRVELSEETAMTLLGAGVATLNAAEAAMLDEMASNATPFLICAKIQGVTIVNGLMQYVLNTGNQTPYYVGTLAYANDPISLEVYNFKKTDGGWEASYRLKVFS